MTSHPSGDVQGRQRVLDRKLRMTMLVPAALGLIQFIIALIEIWRGESPLRSLLWVVPGLAVGYPFGRKVHLDWNASEGHVAMVGGQAVITIAFIVFILLQRVVLKHALSGLENVGTIVLLVTAGVIYGRLIGLYQQIKETMANHQA